MTVDPQKGRPPRLRFHHIGRPVEVDEISDHPDVRFSPMWDMYTVDLPNDLALPVQLHAFGPDSKLDAAIRTEPHVGFVVDDIEAAIADHEVAMPLYEPFPGYRCCMIIVNRQLVELIQTTLSDEEIWSGSAFRNSALYPDS
ncbi:hypothetical protein [Curtobacterium sp. L1-20]|uniref:hypothetical protein n=1 Tax=Curtobacterium sp. L1-20 TaxID=3138181 RepID=UPI003B52B5EC